HYGLVAKFGNQVGNDFIFIKLLETGHDLLHLNDFAIGLVDADLLAIHFLVAHTICLAACSVEQRNIRHMNRHQLVDDAAGFTGHRIGTNGLLGHINAFHDDILGIDARLHYTALAFVLTGQDDDLVIFANLTHDGSLQYFGCERHDFHETFATQLTRNRSENTRTNGLELAVQQHCGVAVELDQRTVLATHALGSTNHHGVVDFALFDATTRR